MLGEVVSWREAPTIPPMTNAMNMRRMMLAHEPSIKAGCEMMLVQRSVVMQSNDDTISIV